MEFFSALVSGGGGGSSDEDCYFVTIRRCMDNRTGKVTVSTVRSPCYYYNDENNKKEGQESKEECRGQATSDKRFGFMLPHEGCTFDIIEKCGEFDIEQFSEGDGDGSCVGSFLLSIYVGLVVFIDFLKRQKKELKLDIQSLIKIKSKQRNTFLIGRLNMKKWSVALLIVMIYLPTGAYGGIELSEFQITSEESNQAWPSIYGNVVIWLEESNETCGTYGCDLSTQRELHITVNENELIEAVIYGNIIVGVSVGSEYCHICGYDLTTSKGFQITKAESQKDSPAIFGNIVVWEDDRNGNWDIYGYDLSTKREFCVTKDENDQNKPAVYGNTIVWEDRGNEIHIKGYDLSMKREFQITKDSEVWQPAIYGNIVVWVDKRNFESVNKNWDIYGYNLSTQEEFRITEGISNPFLPRIYGDIVLWEDDRNGNWDIYGYDLSTSCEFQVTEDENFQVTPAMYGDVIVWTDLRNGYFDNEYVNLDIYGAHLSIDCSGFILQECDFFLEKGVKAVEEKEYESALFFFQLAKQNYMHAGAPEKMEECEEWIQTCQTESEGICGGTALLLMALALGFLGFIRKGQKLVQIGCVTLNPMKRDIHRRREKERRLE